MTASFASSSRISVGRLNQLCSAVESYCLGESARVSLAHRSAIAAGKQREVRQFSSTSRRRSAWAAGHDLGSQASTSTARSSLPSPERSITVGGLAELKSRKEPM
jgi:hypothetical protein